MMIMSTAKILPDPPPKNIFDHNINLFGSELMHASTLYRGEGVIHSGNIFI